MALREIRRIGDEILGKVSKPIKKITARTLDLIEDMEDTMREEDGVGLAAVQVGVLKRLFIVDVGNEAGLTVFINPEIIEKDGVQTGIEGCLSVPGSNGIVERAKHIKVRYFDQEMNEKFIEADDFFARAIQHEYDHIEGRLYVDIATVMDPSPEDYPDIYESAAGDRKAADDKRAKEKNVGDEADK